MPSLKQYIKNTVEKKAKIGYDKEVKQWYGILDHTTGLILSQQKTRVAVKKELTEILEEFIALYLKDKEKDKRHEISAPKTQGAYR